MVLEQCRMAFAVLHPSWPVHPTRFRMRRRHPSERNPAYVPDQP